MVGEISIVLHQDYWGQGIAKEAGFAIAYCGFFTMGLNKIKGCANEHNQRSIVVHEKSGFILEGRLRQEEYKNGVFSDLLVYSLLRDEFMVLYKNDIDNGVCTIVW
jgi:ribosomal-protein-alanine N-acetyltransferase